MAKATKTNTHAAHLIELVIDAPEMGLNQVVIGRAQRIANTKNFGTQNVYEIGSIMPKESVPLRFEGSITVDNLIIRYDSLSKIKPIGMDETGITSFAAEILEKETFDIVVRDKITKREVRRFKDCTLQSMSEDYTSNALLASTATFLYLDHDADKGYMPDQYKPNDEDTVYNRLGALGATGGPSLGIINNVLTNVQNAVNTVNTIVNALT